MKSATKQKQIMAIDREIAKVDQSIYETKQMVAGGELPSWRGDKHLRDLEFAKKEYMGARKIWEELEVHDGAEPE